MFLDALPAADKAADARYGGTGFSSRVPVESLIPFIAFNDLLTGPINPAAALRNRDDVALVVRVVLSWRLLPRARRFRVKVFVSQQKEIQWAFGH
jgi:hypothetical protein